MKRIVLLISIVACLAASTIFTSSAFAVPDGSTNSPWEISDCTTLQSIGTGSYAMDDSYILTASFSCSGISSGAGFDPIGDSSTPFTGTLNGQNNTISGLVETNVVDGYAGLFAYLGTGSVVKNLGITGVSVSAIDDYAGALAGFSDGNITNVYSTGSVSANEDYYIGGLVGWQTDGSITDSHSDAAVSGDYSVGGLIGGGESATFTNDYATGDVTLFEGYGGGFSGYDYDSTYTHDYATGNVTDDELNGGDDGGFIGWTGDDGGDSTQISESYATGNVVGSAYSGGFVGAAKNATHIENSYARGSVTTEGSPLAGFAGVVQDTTVILNSYSTGLVDNDGGVPLGFAGMDAGGTTTADFYDNQTSGQTTDALTAVGKSTADMKTQSTFTDASWNFDSVWTFISGTNDNYACLQFFCNLPPATSATTTQTPTGKAVTLAWNSGCALNTFTVNAESADASQDIAYSYPNGLVNFTLSQCQGPSVTITLTYVGVTNANYVLRKYTTSSQSYTTVGNATLTATTIDGQSAIVATYTVTDNGPLDSNPATGTISDPAGIAQAIISAPQTGEGGTAK